MAVIGTWDGAEVLALTPEVSVLVGEAGGQYPSGNSVLVAGRAETVLIDPSVTVVARGGAPAPVDAVLNSHSHEDHIAGNGLYAHARIHVHEADHPGVASLEGLLDVYGLAEPARSTFSTTILESFHFTPRPDAHGFADGHVFDLGGLRVEAVHLPGHTRGHSGFRIDGGVFFLSDIDLTGFGPYYGDAWSDLDDFEASLALVRQEDAGHYVTFHHKGVIEGRDRFLELLDAFSAVIPRRHEAYLAHLSEPRSVEDLVARRFIYRPHVQHTFADAVERRSAELHLARMLRRGEAVEAEPGRYVAA